MELGAEVVSGSSVKAALDLDIDWDNPEERSSALSKLLVAVQAVETWLEQNQQLSVADSVEQNLKVARQVESQDVEVTVNGTPQLRHGVAKDRRVSVEDPTMRHGRKSRNHRCQLTKAGRAQLRERVAVEHSLAHLGRWQRNRARYIGLRKNLFDLRRTAVVHNLHVWARLVEQATTTSLLTGKAF
jgi:hypothetical protein